MSKLSKILLKRDTRSVSGKSAISLRNFVKRAIKEDMEKFDPKQLEIGKKIEKEHRETIEGVKDNPKTPTTEAEKNIAKDHLKENPEYYQEGCPIVDEEVLLIPASRLARVKKGMITKDIRKGKKLPVLAAYMRLRRGEDKSVYDQFFKVPGFSDTAFSLQTSIAYKPEEILNAAKAAGAKDWTFLNALFKGNQQAISRLVGILGQLKVAPMVFIKLLEDNRYSVPDAMVDLEGMLAKLKERQQYLADLPKQYEQEQMKKFTGNAKNKSPYKKEEK